MVNISLAWGDASDRKLAQARRGLGRFSEAPRAQH